MSLFVQDGSSDESMDEKKTMQDISSVNNASAPITVHTKYIVRSYL